MDRAAVITHRVTAFAHRGGTMNRTNAVKRVIGAVAICCATVATPLVALAATAPAAQAAPAVARAAIPTCTTSGLDISMGQNTYDATGTMYYTVQFTNLSGHACVIEGYPGVAAINMKGHPIGHAAVRMGGSPPVMFTLKNDGQVASSLRVLDPGHFSTSSCKAATAAGLRIYPPDQTTARIVPFPFLTCASSAEHDLVVSLLVKTSSVA